MKKVVALLASLCFAPIIFGQSLDFDTVVIPPDQEYSGQPLGVAVGDFNNDGIDDVVTLEYDGSLRFKITKPLPKSCQEVLDYKIGNTNKKYKIYPPFADPIDVYCDLESFDGPWTLVVGIDTNPNHINNPGEVTPENLISVDGKGKFSDSLINILGPNEIKVICNATERIFPGCEFDSTIAAVGGCALDGISYSDPVGTPYRGPESGNQGYLAYGIQNNAGCHDGSGTGNTGTVWAR